MDEVFVEHIIKRKTTASTVMLRAGSILLTIVLFFLTILSGLGILSLTLLALMIYGVYMLFAMTSIEYEYSLLNGEMTIDRIAGQRKRKRVGVFELKDAEIIADANSEEILRRVHQNMKVCDFSSGDKNNRAYAVILSKPEGVTEVIFEPSEKMLNAMHRVRPSIVRMAND